MKKKLLACILSLVFALCPLAGCGGGSSEDEITVLMWENLARIGENQSTPVSLALEEKFGKKFVYSTADSHPAVGEMLGRLASSNSVPDLVITQSVEIYKYPKYFVDYTQYTSEMPNMFRYVDEPEVKSIISNADGSIVLAPTIHDTQVSVAYMIRTDWLDNLGLAVPDTFEDFDAVIRAFAEDDPNLDGGATKEYGFYPMGSQEWLREYAYNFNASPDTVVRDGQLVYGPSETQFKEAIQYLNDLYDIGAIDPEFVTGDVSTYKERISTGKVGFTRAYINRMEDITVWSRANDPNATWQIILPPVDSSGKRYEQNYNLRAGNMGIAINKNSKNRDLLIEMVDYLYSEEGQLLTQWGVEGVTYELNDDGEPEMLDIVRNNPTWPDSLTTKTYFGIEPGSHFSMVQNKDTFVFSEATMAGFELYDDNSELFDNLTVAPPVTLFLSYDDDEKQAALVDYYEIKRRSDTAIYNFIRGSQRFAEWDSYLSDINSLGLTNVMTQLNKAYQRTVG